MLRLEATNAPAMVGNTARTVSKSIWKRKQCSGSSSRAIRMRERMSQSHLNPSQPVASSPHIRGRGVIDLRAYASNATPTADWLAGRGTPAFLDARASVVALAPVGAGRVEALSHDEFL